MAEGVQIIGISPSVQKLWNLQLGSTQKLSCGNNTINIKISSISDAKSDPQQTFISKDLAQVLGLPCPVHANVIKKMNQLRIGPLVGVLASRFDKSKASFGSQDGYYRRLMENLNHLHGIGFVFTHQGIDWQRKMIRGYYLTENGDWQQHRFPMPDVCYNRFFRSKNSPHSRDTMSRLGRLGVRSFNTTIGNKWRIFNMLGHSKDIKPHLPDTGNLISSSMLESWLDKYGSVYIKPVKGCRGQGVTRVTKQVDRYLVKGAQDNNARCLLHPREVFSSIKKLNDDDTLIIQRSISCRGKEGHFDVRALVQKDRSNQWHVTGIAARVGAEGKVTTNLHTGGHAEKLAELLVKRGFENSEVTEIISEINRLALQIAHVIEKNSRAVGELGLDFIIDSIGKVWFLEANPKPGRQSFLHMSLETRRLTGLRPMEYACFLAGF
ncbi:MAG: YheC/YheD family protein [Acidobacteriota bacterium]